ncbi:RNA-directed DNA polymerase from transposon X-element [Penicillium sp. DV-2018c]|nr:RNA-directed DNA polymerase from transposon X-element [Penicillium sp. DV-2018c]
MLSALELAFGEKCDIVCIQEPWTTKTQTHPGFGWFAPVDEWDGEDWSSKRPRVLTYVRKDPTTRAQQHRPVLNLYREPTTPEVIDYLTSLEPENNCLVGGDLNARHDAFEPGAESLHGGGEIARWAALSGMSYIGEPGVPTHQGGHVLDLTFTNIPFATTEVRDDLHTGSDHETLVTTIPGRNNSPLEQTNYRVAEKDLPKFASLVAGGIHAFPSPHDLDTNGVERYAERLSSMIGLAIQTAGTKTRTHGRSVPWWNAKCHSTHLDWITERTEVLQTTTDTYALMMTSNNMDWFLCNSL